MFSLSATFWYYDCVHADVRRGIPARLASCRPKGLRLAFNSNSIINSLYCCKNSKT